METVEVLLICGFNIIAFIVGARIGQKVVKQEKIEVNPVKIVSNSIQEHKIKKEKEEEDEYYKAILHNIDVYDGTSAGQVKVPIRRK